jgi:hypothetical protein
MKSYTMSVVMFVTEGFADPKPVEADIEDLIDPAVYGDLVSQTYRKELTGKTLALNPSIPRIVKRYEEAFAALGMEFYKTRPAREFMSRMGDQPDTVLPATSAARFEAVFKALSDRYNRLKANDRGPFK